MKNKLRIRRKLCLLFSLLLTFSSFAQEVVVKGTIVDESKIPIIGANILVKGMTLGTITDFNGAFTISAPSKQSILHITYVGFRDVQLSVAQVLVQTTITMHEDAKLLEGVVVIGYGQVKKADATGSVLSVKPDELNKGSQVSAQDALVGKIAGVSVTSASGSPGSGATIRVRAGSSLSASNDPLIVIDGVPIDNSSVNGSSNIIGAINPADIESFTVLKDASSTAIYGSRASNGVIIITTKKGKRGSTKMEVNYTTNFSLSTVNDYVDVLSADDYRSTFAKKAGAAAAFQLGTTSTDWQKEIYRTAIGQEHNASVTGAYKNIPYRFSVGYTNQQGIIKTNNYERFSASMGLSPKFFTDHLALNINLKASSENNDKVSSSVVGDAISFDPTRGVRATTPSVYGLGYYTWTSGGVPIAIAPNNPVAELELMDKINNVKRSIGSVSMTYKLHGYEELHFHTNIGYDLLRSTYNEHAPEKAPKMYISNQKDGTGLSYLSTQDKRNTLLDLYVDYDKTFASLHHVNAMLGYGWQHFWSKFSDSTHDTQSKQLNSPKHTETEYYLLSYYGRVNYSLAQKYLLTLTFRADASSRFSSDNRWGYFPSAAFAWRINNEDFLKNINALSDLKLRLSYGKTGQQDIISDYPYLATYTASYDEVRYKLGDKWYTTYRPDGYDSSIKWETTTTYNIGLDWGFLSNRIAGSIDYYQRETKDLLNNIYVSAGSNFTNMINTNVGSMENKGLEIAVNAIPIKTKKIEWSIGANFTWNNSKITKLNQNDTDNNYVKTGNAGGTGKYLQIHKVGETPYTFFLLKQAYNEEGDAIDGSYIAKDGSISTSEEDANKYVTGKSSQAPYFYGLSTRLVYKNWDLGLNGHGSIGNYVFNYLAAKNSFDNMYSSQGTSSNILQSTIQSGFSQQRLYSDYFLEKASFFRLDNITIGYTFKHLWNTTSNLRLSFAAQNVCTITGYTGIDPEIYSGIDNNVYQRPRLFMVGLNLNF